MLFSTPTPPSENTSLCRVVLADDHAVVRENLRALLEASGMVTVVGVAEDGQAAVHLTAQLHPEIALLDLAMPELNGIEATWQIVLAYPTTRVIIFSVHTAPEYVAGAFRAGASGYVAKETVGTDILAAIQAVRAHQRYLSPKISAKHSFANLLGRLDEAP